jgi:putative membrane protein
LTTISGLPAFLAYFVVSLGLTALYLVTYLTATAHREIALVREGNLAAALALGGSLLGYSIPLSAAVRYAGSLLDCIVWGLVALVVQVAIYWLMRPLLPNLSQRIDEGQTAPAVLLGAASLAGGLVNAACMSY